MSKTLSLIIRIIAVLAALGAGAAYYIIQEDQIANAIAKTAWIDSDKPLNDEKNLVDPDNKDYVAHSKDETLLVTSSVFTDRVNRHPGLKIVLDNKRKEITEKRQQIEARDVTIGERNETIAQKNAEITKLETEKAELIRANDELKSKLEAANGNITRLESEKSSLQAENQRLTEEMKDETKYVPRANFDTEVKNRQAAEDKLSLASRRYTNFWNWVVKNTGARPPQDRILNLNASDDVPVTPQPKDAAPRIPTKIVTVDLRKGVLAISIGRTTTGIRPGSFYDVEINGSVVGKIRLSEVDTSISTAEILPGSAVTHFVQNAIIQLVPVQTETKAEATTKPAPAAAAPLSAAPAAPVLDLPVAP